VRAISGLSEISKAPLEPDVSRKARDRIVSVRTALTILPLQAPISDAKVLTGRQKPLSEVAVLFAEVFTEHGWEGLGFSYSKRAGGPGMFAHAAEVAPELHEGASRDGAFLLWRCPNGTPARPWPECEPRLSFIRPLRSTVLDVDSGSHR
jgi:hypothetical protein